MPLFSMFFFIFIIFNASAPLSLNFVGEFLSLSGIFTNSPFIGVLASSGIVFSAIYSIFLFNRISFLGFSPYLNQGNIALGDLNRLEFHLLLPLLIATLLLGLFPNLILEPLHYDVTQLLYTTVS
jgi:NADH-ubiquinone oxidoreductase chain 4